MLVSILMRPWPKAWPARADSYAQENLLDKQVPLSELNCLLDSYSTKEGKKPIVNTDRSRVFDQAQV